MDLQLPGMSGVDAIRTIRRSDPNARIIVLTMYDGDEDIHRALEAGATTYLLKGSPSDELDRASSATCTPAAGPCIPTCRRGSRAAPRGRR